MTPTTQTRILHFEGVRISLAVSCIIFIFLSAGLLVYYVPLTDNQQAQINSLHSQISQLENQLGNSSSEISNYSSQIASLQRQLSDANNINKLQVIATWVNNEEVTVTAGVFFSYANTTNYAGFVGVSFDASDPGDYSLKASWSANGLVYNNTWSLGRRDGVAFPVLPSNNVMITLTCNNKPILNLPAFVTITYTY